MAKPGLVYPDGADAVWLATDAIGHLAAFVTAGIAPIPRQLLQRDSLDSIAKAIDEWSPAHCGCRTLATAGAPDSFADLGGRGLFVFDWQDIHRVEIAYSGAYEAVCIPDHPVSITAIPATLRETALRSRIACDFSKTSSIDVRDHFDCLDAEEARNATSLARGHQ